MEAAEFIKLNSHEVRNSPSLMAIYADFYFQVYGTKLNCNTCGFDSKLRQLQNALKTSNVKPKDTIMEKTFQLRQVKGEILTYKNEGKTVRQYDNRMTEEFAINYLTFGTPEQIEERKKLFKKLPKDILKPSVNTEKTEHTEKAVKATKRTKK